MAASSACVAVASALRSQPRPMRSSALTCPNGASSTTVFGSRHRKDRARSPDRKKAGPANRYALSGIARCAKCTGSIGAKTSRLSDGSHGHVYACNWHHERGAVVCPVKVRQPIEEVEESLADYLAEDVLTEASVEQIMSDARGELERQLRTTGKDSSALEAELSQLRGEQRNLATAVAVGGDMSIPELVAELQRRNGKIRMLEADVAASKRSPQVAAELLASTEASVRRKVFGLRETLMASPGDAREVFQAVFPDGLGFYEAEIEAENGTRRVWEVRGASQLGAFSFDCDPTGAFRK